MNSYNQSSLKKNFSTISSNGTYSSDFCNELLVINTIYLRESLSGLGFILNLFCTYIFFKIIRNIKANIDLYKYFLLESIINSYICLRIMLKNVFDCKNCEIEKYYAMKVILWFFFYYVDYSLELMSIMISVMSGFNRYRSIDNFLNVFDKIPFFLVNSLVAIFCGVFCAYKLFDITIETTMKNNSTYATYYLKSNKLGQTALVFDQMYTLIRDAIPIFAILLLNILTMIKIKKTMKKKEIVTRRKKRLKDSNTELRLNLMVVVTSSIVLLSHLANFIFWLKVFETNECFNLLRNFLYWTSYGINFFIYLFFNLKFQIYFINLIPVKRL